MIEILKYENNMSQEWDTFINASYNGTLFHKQCFLSYHIKRKFDDSSFIFKKRGEIIAILPAAIQMVNNKKILFSHPGASFGGLVHAKLGFKNCFEIITILEKFCKKKLFHEIFIVQTPVIFNRYENNEIVDFCLRNSNYNTDENYLSSVLMVSDNLNSQLKNLARNKKRSSNYYNSLIKKNEIQFKWVKKFDEFYPILIKNKKKHKAKPTHSIKELDKLKKILPDEILQLMIYSKKNPLGGMTVFKITEKSIVLFYSMFDYTYQHLQPITLLMQYIISWAKKNEIKFIDYGVSNQPKTKGKLALNISLIKFKEEFGCFSSIRNTYRKSL